MSALTLTGAIPGLLRRGSPVRTANSRGGVCDIVTHYPNGVHCMTVFEGLTDQRLAALDLTDPTGRYHALLWLRERGHDLRWAENEAEVLAWSVLSVARGGGPIKAILPEWTTPPDYHGMSAARCAGHRSEWLHVRVEPFRGGCSGVEGEVVIGWEFWPQSLRGSEIGHEGRAAADRAALGAGYALRNEDGTLTIPLLPEVVDGG